MQQFVVLSIRRIIPTCTVSKPRVAPVTNTNTCSCHRLCDCKSRHAFKKTSSSVHPVLRLAIEVTVSPIYWRIFTSDSYAWNILSMFSLSMLELYWVCSRYIYMCVWIILGMFSDTRAWTILSMFAGSMHKIYLVYIFI